MFHLPMLIQTSLPPRFRPVSQPVGSLLALLLLSGCGTALQPRPQSVPSAQQPTQATGSAVRQSPEQTVRSSEVPDKREPQSEHLPDATPRIPWVNPARCLPSCAFDPGTKLVRVNDRAEEDEKGRHRILSDVREPLVQLLAAAKAQGHALRIESAFRSYEDQVRVFTTIKEIGRAARPGHSEHQLGSVIDLRIRTGAAIEWLALHAADFGFALSYPAQKQRITGYRPEPWHIRYIGTALAQRARDEKLSVEELLRSQPDLGESGACTDCPHPASVAACGDIPASGRCDKTVLSWCYEGSLASVDCGSTSQTCGQRPGSEEFDCLPKATDSHSATDSQRTTDSRSK
ncbi:MAG: M15 family metallopeptidase [Myxococcales bacterium]|nr:M15 family metallopeptidase [Myxococcales bacterium]